MSTNSRIGYIENGKTKSIYCHWDGYINHNGVILGTFYKTLEEVKELVELGDLSVLGKRIGEKVDFNKMSIDPIYREKYDGQCVAYHRDREEDLCISTMSIVELEHDQEFNYLFNNGQWYVSCNANNYTFIPLDFYLKEIT